MTLRLTPLISMTVVVLYCACGTDADVGQRESNYQPEHHSTFDSGPAELGPGVAHVVDLKGRPLVHSTTFGRPFFLAASAGKLWVADISGEPWFHLVRIADGTVEVSGGGRGEGPGYFQSVADISQRPGDAYGVWVFDVQLGRLTYVPGEANLPDIETIVAQAPEARPYAMRWVTRNSIVGVRPSDTTASLVLYDSLGNAVRSTRFEILGDSTIPYRKRRVPSGGFRVCVKPDGSQFAVLFVAGGRIDRFQADLTRLAGFKVPFRSNGDFERDSLGRWQAYIPRQYYRDCAATATHLYALFSGRLVSKFPQAEGGEGAYVQVFNWEGDLERVMRLSRSANAFVVLGDTALFATTIATDTIYEYPLPRF